MILTLYIKNMVCIRCKMKVKEELSRLEIHYTGIELGEVELVEEISREKREELKASLLLAGLELMDDNKSVLMQRIKKCHYRHGTQFHHPADLQFFSIPQSET